MLHRVNRSLTLFVTIVFALTLLVPTGAATAAESGSLLFLPVVHRAPSSFTLVTPTPDQTVAWWHWIDRMNNVPRSEVGDVDCWPAGDCDLLDRGTPLPVWYDETHPLSIRRGKRGPPRRGERLRLELIEWVDEELWLSGP